MTGTQQITDRDLRGAFQRSGLWRIGMTFERAIEAPHIRTALTCSANAARRHTEPADIRTPSQLCLI